MRVEVQYYKITFFNLIFKFYICGYLNLITNGSKNLFSRVYSCDGRSTLNFNLFESLKFIEGFQFVDLVLNFETDSVREDRVKNCD